MMTSKRPSFLITGPAAGPAGRPGVVRPVARCWRSRRYDRRQRVRGRWRTAGASCRCRGCRRQGCSRSGRRSRRRRACASCLCLRPAAWSRRASACMRSAGRASWSWKARSSWMAWTILADLRWTRSSIAERHKEPRAAQQNESRCLIFYMQAGADSMFLQ